jgi:hypothetical protein
MPRGETHNLLPKTQGGFILAPDSLHSAFGLIWSSPDLPLLDLPEVAPEEEGGGEMVVISREGSGHWPPLPEGPLDTPWLQMAPGELRLQVEGIARFRIRDGERIAFAPRDGAVSDQDLRTFLLGSAVGAALIQRGMLVLHGNALERDGRAIVCLGPSKAGKSTLAYGLMRQGWQLLADDLVAITPSGQVLPGIPRIKLWHDAARAFGLDPDALPPIRQGMRKVLLSGEAVRRASRPVPLKALYVLEGQRLGGGETCQPSITPIGGERQAVIALCEQSYRPRFVRGLGREGSTFLALARLQREVPPSRLRLPEGIAAMQDWLLEQDLLQGAGDGRKGNSSAGQA